MNCVSTKANAIYDIGEYIKLIEIIDVGGNDIPGKDAFTFTIRFLLYNL